MLRASFSFMLVFGIPLYSVLTKQHACRCVFSSLPSWLTFSICKFQNLNPNEVMDISKILVSPGYKSPSTISAAFPLHA